MQVYSPYVFINKTQLPFWLRPSSRDFSAYRGMSSCCAQDPEGHRYFEPILLSMPNSDRKAVLAQLKLAESEWSKVCPYSHVWPHRDNRLLR